MGRDGSGLRRAGIGAPVVLLHGGLLGRGQWDAEFADLAAGHHVVRVDLRNHGGSPAAAGDWANHADLIAVLDHLGIERVTAVGLSLGARTIIDAALLHPQRFQAVLLASPGYSGMEFTDPFVEARNAAMARAAAALDADAFVEAFLRLWVDGRTGNLDRPAAFAAVLAAFLQRSSSSSA